MARRLLHAIKVFWSRDKVPRGARIILARKPRAKRIKILGMKDTRKILLFIFFATFIIYFISSSGNTPYNYFTRLGDSFLHGKYYITENPSWLSELIPAGLNMFYVPYPPMPAIISIPFVFIFGASFPQQILAQLLGAGVAVFIFLISMTIKKDIRLAIWSTILVSFGSIVWFMSSNGSVWLVGQITSVFFLTLAVWEALNKKRLFVIGVCIGAVYLCRPHVILALPFLVYLLRERIRSLKDIVVLGVSALPFFLFGFFYNFIRFGSIFDKAYFLLPKVLHEENAPWFIHGVESILYIPNNLRTIFWSFPKIIDKFPYIIPSWNGLAIWITTPAFIYALGNKIKERVVGFAWLSIFLISLVIFSHGGNGFAQFGYRFAVDFYPILIFLVIKAVSNKGLKWHHWVLLFIGVVVNFWGVTFINKLGFVSF